MPWQQQVADVALEVGDDGILAYRQVILTVPRQSGKTTLLLVLLLFRALASPGQQIRYTAQNGTDARKKWKGDWLPILKASRFSQLFTVTLANGHEGLDFANGSHQGLVGATKKAGHGGTLVLGIIDEAFAQPDARLEQALLPAMNTRTQPQLWIVSTAGTFEDSPYLWDKVEKGRTLAEGGMTRNVAYFEWSAHEDDDPGDENVWRSCMPALGHTTGIDAVRLAYESMSLSEFRRAYLNQWVTQQNDPVIPLDLWNDLEDPDSTIAGRPCFAFDVTPDRSSASIAAAGVRSDDLRHVEIVDNRPGTHWVVPRVLQLRDRHSPTAILVDASGPAGSLIPEFDRNGVEVVPVSAKDHARACGSLYDSCVDGTLRHGPSDELLFALDGAAKRPLGDAWAWSRKSSSVDISPLVAATLALWGTEMGGADPTPQVWDLNALVAEMNADKG